MHGTHACQPGRTRKLAMEICQGAAREDQPRRRRAVVDQAVSAEVHGQGAGRQQRGGADADRHAADGSAQHRARRGAAQHPVELILLACAQVRKMELQH